MKKLPCHYPKCGERRIHWTQQDIKRGTQYIEVDDHIEKAYCSYTCAILDGYMKLDSDDKNHISTDSML